MLIEVSQNVPRRVSRAEMAAVVAALSSGFFAELRDVLFCGLLLLMLPRPRH